MNVNFTKKKIYKKPLMEVIAVDNVVSMGVPSDPGGFAPPPAPPAPAPPSTLKSVTPSEESNPFGGSEPDYSN